tara:strand:+ start:2017 stop:2274 length:258 start_codon:yes stop_codon:yes gene_type:complete
MPVTQTAASNPILLVGDLTYEAGLIEQGVVAGMGNKGTSPAIFEKVRRLKEPLPGLVIVDSHDPGAGGALLHATGRLFDIDKEKR